MGPLSGLLGGPCQHSRDEASAARTLCSPSGQSLLPGRGGKEALKQNKRCSRLFLGTFLPVGTTPQSEDNQAHLSPDTGLGSTPLY